MTKQEVLKISKASFGVLQSCFGNFFARTVAQAVKKHYFYIKFKIYTMANTFDFSQDDEACIRFILSKLPEALRNRVDEDDVQYFLDAEWDYYDSEGLLEDSSESVEIDEEKLAAYILKAAAKEGMTHIDGEVLEAFLDAEYEYNSNLYK